MSANSEMQCNMMHETGASLSILTHKCDFTNLHLAFLFINDLTKHYKLNNMRFRILIRLFDFIQVLNIKMRLSTKDEYCSTHIQFTTIYLQQEQILNHRNYSCRK
jgi:hypothetical protein